MSRYAIGSYDSIRCFDEIKPFYIKTKEGDVNVCFAVKIKENYIILPWHTFIDDYVLKATDSTGYYEIDRALTQNQQKQGNLPEILPRYSLTTNEILWGHSLWIILFILLLGFLKDTIFNNHGSKISQDHIKVKNGRN